MLARKGFTRAVLSLGFMSEKIISHFDSSYMGMELAYEVELQPLGTGGAIRVALTRCVTDHVFIFNGDTYLDLEVDDVERVWQSRQYPILVVREVSDTTRFGRVEIRDGRVMAFQEKGQSGPGLINAGCYVLPRTVLDDFPLCQPFSLEIEFFMKSLQFLRVDGFITKGRFIDID